MECVQRDQKAVIIRLSRAELITITNALNEVCNGIALPEFETRLNTTKEEADTLQQALGALFDMGANQESNAQ